MEMDLVDIIESCMEDKDSELSYIRMKLYQAALDFRQRALNENIPDDQLTEFELKIRSLKGAEREGNLAWMSFASWYKFPIILRERFKELVNPFMYGEVYFLNSYFSENSSELLSYLDNTLSLAVIRDGKCFQYVCIDSLRSRFTNMGNMDFERFLDNFRKRLIRVYGVKNGEICCKEVGIEKSYST